MTPTDLLGDSPLARQRTAALLAPAVTALGSRRAKPPTLDFCRPASGAERTLFSIRTPCAAAYPR